MDNNVVAVASAALETIEKTIQELPAIVGAFRQAKLRRIIDGLTTQVTSLRKIQTAASMHHTALRLVAACDQVTLLLDKSVEHLNQAVTRLLAGRGEHTRRNVEEMVGMLGAISVQLQSQIASASSLRGIKVAAEFVELRAHKQRGQLGGYLDEYETSLSQVSGAVAESQLRFSEILVHQRGRGPDDGLDIPEQHLRSGIELVKSLWKIQRPINAFRAVIIESAMSEFSDLSRVQGGEQHADR